MDIIPPVGENTLLDCFDDPHHAGKNRHNILDRIPKTRLCFEELLPDSSGKLWGLNIQSSGYRLDYDHIDKYGNLIPGRIVEPED
jgi:hypothetical protein